MNLNPGITAHHLVSVALSVETVPLLQLRCKLSIKNTEQEQAKGKSCCITYILLVYIYSQTFWSLCCHTNTKEVNLTNAANLFWVNQIPSPKEYHQCHRSVCFSLLSLHMRTSCHHRLGGTWQPRSQSASQRFPGHGVLLSFTFPLQWSHTLWRSVITYVKKLSSTYSLNVYNL